MQNDARRAASGASFRSPAAIDHATNTRNRNGATPAEGFQDSVNVAGPTDRQDRQIPAPTASANQVPPRRRANTTTPTMQAVATSPATTAGSHSGPTLW